MIVCYRPAMRGAMCGAMHGAMRGAMRGASAYRENGGTFPGLDEYGSGQQWFLPQPESLWSRTELLIGNCLPAKRSDQKIKQQYGTYRNTEYRLWAAPSSPPRLDERG